MSEHTANTGSSLLSVVDLAAGYDGRTVIQGLDLEVGRGEAVALFGSNGAGKTTTLKAISGLLRPSAGRVAYDGSDWRAERPWRAAQAGMRFIPAERFTFAGLSVRENLQLGAYTQTSGADDRLDLVFEAFPILADRLDQAAGTMSGGQQRMLSIGVALMSKPQLLLLDEPSLGLAPAVVEQVFGALRRLVESGIAVLLVEQNVGQAVQFADRVYVMRSGRIIEELLADDAQSREQWWDLF